jgi:hypothetical protein
VSQHDHHQLAYLEKMDTEEALKARAMYEHMAELASYRLPALIEVC